jgi:Tol biopolymer transport system component
LTNHAFEDHAPAFSPDGSRIAFTSDRDGNAEIYVMDADGANVRRLTDNAAADFGPAFSADGRATGVTAMRISNTAGGLSSANWIAYTPTREWTLSSGAGTKTVYVQYRDAAGNQSALVQDTIRSKP